jgi:predicted PurR-regulated permease PerM
MSIPDLFTSLFVFFGMVGALLPGYEAFVARLKRLSPLDDRIDDIFLRKLKLTVWAMFISIFVIAIVDGLVTGVFIWMAGVPYSSVWTLIAVVASMLPLGASLVAIPIGIVQLLVGNPTGAVIILAGYLLVVSNIDTLLRPRLAPKEANLSFALSLLSAVAGYALFGFFGVIYGPVLMVMFLTTVDIYEEYYSGTPPPAEEQPVIETPEPIEAGASAPAPPAIEPQSL